MKIEKAIDHKQEALALLKEENLPVDDLSATLDNFIVAIEEGAVAAVAGLEVYGSCGLLRSVAVKPGHRKKGLAGDLVTQIEQLALGNGLNAIYLLTETAPGYFAQKGYVRIARTDVPAEAQTAPEFTHTCPQSAIVMKKKLQE